MRAQCGRGVVEEDAEVAQYGVWQGYDGGAAGSMEGAARGPSSSAYGRQCVRIVTQEASGMRWSVNMS